ncbi:MAG: hypothetical protein RLZZ293_260, partial [Pseudomonadota bacterium]
KTITALEVITRYIRNKQRVVVICPKSLENQWEHAIRKHGLNLDVISLQNEAKFDQHMQFDRYAPVGLFVIDESHNLRTGSSSSRFEKVRQWIKQNNNAHSLLLTATPINNSISDLLNQILLASGGDANVLMLPTSNGRGMQNVVEIINSIRKSESKIEELTAEKLAERRARLHPILKEFVVRRTRQGILREQEVSNFEPKLHFPQEYLYVRSYDFALKLTPQLVTQTTSELTNPRINNLGQIIHKIYTICEIYTEYDENGQSIEKTLDDKLTILKHPIDQLDNFSQFHEVEYLSKCSPLRLVYQIIQFLGFIPYRYMIYHRDFYNKDLADIKLLPITPQQIILNRQKGLYGILRVVFLKRLESSFYALEVSLNNYRTILEQFKQAIQRNILLSLADLRNIIDQYGDDYSIDNLNIVNETSQVYDLADFEKQKMLNDIEKELSLLDVLAIQLNLLQQDNDKIKDLAALFRLIQQEHPEYNQGKPKILVFSYFADTIKHLEQQFKHYFNYQAEQCAFICGSNRTKIDQLTGRFAPKGKDYQLGQDETELQYLFATDVLSEGQNLQDCAILINYDLHWNPVRMIQRNGRINRIGSEYAKVLIYNMHPHSQLEEYLKLVKRLEYKIGLIRDTVGQDQRILTADEQLNPIEFSDDIEIDKLTALYSQTQANTIMQQLEDDEEYLTDDKFITDLRYFDAKYQDNPEYKQQIYNIAKGKFGRLDTKERNLLILTQMNDSNGKKLFNKFFMIEAKNKGIKSMDDLHALKLIRTDENNNQRQTGQQYKRYLDYLAKDYPQKFIATLNSLNNQERELDTGMQNLRTKFLKLILGMNYPEDICSMFDQALLYSNYSDYNQINKKLKRILKQPSSNEINQLLNFCEKSINSLDNSSNFTQPISCEGILYYGN